MRGTRRSETSLIDGMAVSGIVELRRELLGELRRSGGLLVEALKGPQ